MQYYLKIFNEKTEELVGYYRDNNARNCVSRLLNGARYYNNLERALEILEMLDGGFIRDKDNHYYNAFVVICGDSKKESSKEEKKSLQESEEEKLNELEAFIRKTNYKNR